MKSPAVVFGLLGVVLLAACGSGTAPAGKPTKTSKPPMSGSAPTLASSVPLPARITPRITQPPTATHDFVPEPSPTPFSVGPADK